MPPIFANRYKNRIFVGNNRKTECLWIKTQFGACILDIFSEKALALFLAVETSTISNVAKEVKLMLTLRRGLHFDICATGSRRPQQQIEKVLSALFLCA